MYEIIENFIDSAGKHRLRVSINNEQSIILKFNDNPTNELIETEVNKYLNSITPYTRPDPISVIPQTISARQVRIWLIQNNISLDQVDNIINNIQDPIMRDITKVEWEYAPYIERNHPMLPVLAEALGLDSFALDQAFVEASQI